MSANFPFVTLLASAVPAIAAAAPAPPPTPAPPAIVQIGSAYFAKQMCSCLFVVGRSEASCRAEFKPRMDVFIVTIERTGMPATAKVGATLGPVAALAAFDRGYGCVLVK